jgi:hypothetical protein
LLFVAITLVGRRFGPSKFFWFTSRSTRLAQVATDSGALKRTPTDVLGSPSSTSVGFASQQKIQVKQ